MILSKFKDVLHYRTAESLDKRDSFMDDTKNSSEEDRTIIEVNDFTPESPEEDDSQEPIMEDPFNPAKINVTQKIDTLHNVIERLRYNEIDMNTDFQRHADLWDSKKMSRLIESILIRFPLPAFYFDASNDDKWLIVDGLQRLSSIRRFIIEENSRTQLRLHGLEYLTKFDGMSYNDLPRAYKRRIDECSLTLFLIQKGTPEEVKYSIFRRINTGGLTLTDQEIRNAMAKPETRECLECLAQDEYLKKTIGDQSRRMVDQELALRFLAFKFMDYEKDTRNITSFLDGMIEKLDKADEPECSLYKEKFHTAIKRCWQLFGDSAFEKRTEETAQKRHRKNSTLFEVWTTSLADLSEENMTILIQNKEPLIAMHQKLIETDEDYFRSITYSTQKRDHFRIRRDKVKQLINEVLNA